MEQLANNPVSTITSGISSGATSLTVASATLFPTAGNFVIKIDNELLVVTNVSGTTFTVTRGQDGTSAASHSSGAAITQVVSKKVLENLYAEMYQIGDVASRPTTARGGTVYYGTDLDVEWLYNGTNWDLVWPAYVPYANRVNIGSWTSINLGTTTWTDYNGVMAVSIPDVNTQLKGYYHTIPSAPFSCYTVVGLGGTIGGQTEAGIMLYDSGTGKLRITGATSGGLSVGMTQVTAFNGTYSGQQSFQIAPFNITYLKFTDDNTNWHYYWSSDGSNWIEYFKEARNTNLTPNSVGIYVRGTTGINTLYRNFYGYWEN
jgi:hypothetical protein